MKYWVYKESRILGPFDKEDVSGLPGFDSGTLVCAGDPAGGAWTPAGELEGLKTSASPGALFSDPPSSVALLDQLQIDAAGLIGDDEYAVSFAEELFQDASLKTGFGDAMAAGRSPADEAEARRYREKISELTAQLEAMYRHISALESGQTDMARRLAAKDFESGTRGGAAGPAKTFLSAAPPPIPGGPPPVAAVPGATYADPSSEWPQPPADAPGFPSFEAAGAPPPAAPGSFPSFPGAASAPPAPPPPPLPPAPAPAEAGPALPAMPSFAAAPSPAELKPEPFPEEQPAPPKTLSFGKPKAFKVVPTIKAFKVVGADDAAPAASQNPAPVFTVEPVAEAPAAAPPPPAPTLPEAPSLPPPPVLAPPPAAAAPAPEAVMPTLAPIAPAPIPVLAPAPAPAALPPNPFMTVQAPPPASAFPTQSAFPAQAGPAAPTPVPPPPNTLSAMPPLSAVDDLVGAGAASPPATMARSGASAPKVEEGPAARFAKPEPEPATGEVKKPARSNKKFLIGGAALVGLLIVVGVIFMRQPKEDIKQMAALDDGKAPIGAAVDDSAAPPPIVKPKLAAPPAEPPQPAGPSPEHLAAIALVKDFPLDGGRGTVGKWLQYSYTADPNAGTEEWNASTTAENTVLVEYRLVPGAAGGKGALYLFEADPNGIVMGKNLEARQMLAGSPPAETAPAPKKKSAKKAGAKRPAKKRRAAVEEPKEVPLLPLPDSGELRPPAEDDATFGSDTVNQGI